MAPDGWPILAPKKAHHQSRRADQQRAYCWYCIYFWLKMYFRSVCVSNNASWPWLDILKHGVTKGQQRIKTDRFFFVANVVEKSDRAWCQRTADARRQPSKDQKEDGGAEKRDRTMHGRGDEIPEIPIQRVAEHSCDNRCHLSALFRLGGRRRVRGEGAFLSVRRDGWVRGGGSGHLYRLWRGQPRDRNPS